MAHVVIHIRRGSTCHRGGGLPLPLRDAPQRSRRLIAVCRLVVCGILAMGLEVAPALAQGNHPSHWGASVSFTPHWEAYDTFQELLYDDGQGTIEGSEFTVGVVRGSARGGEWGVSYVRKPITDGTTLTDGSESSTNGFTSSFTSSLVFRDVYLQGVEFHRFMPFGTIKNRVQIGLNIAGGIAFVEGTIEETSESFSQFPRPNGTVQTETRRDTYVVDADEIIYKYQPLFKLEGQVAVIVAPALKLKVGAGVNLPSVFAFRVGAVVLFGGR